MDKQWHEDRLNGIGGSEASIILGINPWQSRLELYHKKVNRIIPDDNDKSNIIFDIGHALEPVIAKYYTKMTNRVIESRPQKTHPEYPFITGNIDREIVKSERLNPGILEIKTKGAHINWHDQDIPPYYIVQLQQYLAVYGYSWGSFAVLDLEKREISITDVERDESLINYIIEEEKQFWNYNILQKIPPEIEPTEACLSFLKETYKTPEPITIDLIGNREATWKAEELNRIKKTYKELDSIETDCKTFFMNLMKNAEVAIGNNYIITWKKDKDSSKFNTDKFKLDNPQLYNKYLEPKKGSRRFLTKYNKE